MAKQYARALRGDSRGRCLRQGRGRAQRKQRSARHNRLVVWASARSIHGATDHMPGIPYGARVEEVTAVETRVFADQRATGVMFPNTNRHT